MLSVGITGGMGTGKSTVCKIWECLQIPVLDTDALSKHLLQTNKELQIAVCNAFGNDVIENNIVNKSVLASRAFSSNANTQLLNSIVHPFVFKAIDDWQAKQNSVYTIRESALLIESGSYKNLDIIIGITAPLQFRIDRIVARNNFTPQEVIARIEKQMDEKEKENFYQFTIQNFEPHFLIPQVLNIHQQILALIK